MGLFGSIRRTVKSVAEKAGVEDEVDAAEDAFQRATGVDLGGSGGGKNDPDVKKQGAEDPGNQGKTEGAIDKAVSTARDFADEAKDKIEEATQGGSNNNNASGNTGSGRDEYNQVDEFQNNSGGGSGGGSSEDVKEAAKYLKDPSSTVDSKDAKDQNILSSEKGEVFENPAEMALSQAQNVEDLQDKQDFNQYVRYKNFEESRENKQEVSQALNRTENLISQVKGSEADTFRVEGEKVSRDELVESLQERKNSLSATESKISARQNARIATVSAVNQRQRKKASAEEIAEKRDIDNFQLSYFGMDTGIELKGKAAEAAMVADAFTSGGDSSGRILGAAVDQYIPGGDDKTVENVAEQNTIQNTRQLERNGFDPVREGFETVTSVPGLVGTAYAGGYAFGAGTKALQASSVTGTGYLASGLQVAGVGAAGAETVRKTKEVGKELSEGKQASAIGTGIELTAELADLYAGAKAGTKAFRARVGSTESSQVNVLKQTDGDGFYGRGEFEGTTTTNRKTFQKPYEVRNPLGGDSRLRSPVKLKNPVTTTTEQVSFEGRYNIDAGENTVNTEGRVKFDTDGDEFSKDFESVQNVRNTGIETRQGNKLYSYSGTTRSKQSGRLFNYRSDVDTQGLAVLSGRTKGYENIDFSSLSDSSLQVSGSADGAQKITVNTRSSDGSRFGTAENYVFGSSSADGSSGSGAGVSSSNDGGQVAVSESSSGSGITSSYGAGEAYSLDVDSLSRSQLRNYYGGGSGVDGAEAGLASGIESQFESSGTVQESQGTDVSTREVSQPVTSSLQTVDVSTSRVSQGGGQGSQSTRSNGGQSTKGSSGVSVGTKNIVESDVKTGTEVGPDIGVKNQGFKDFKEMDLNDNIGFQEKNPQVQGLGQGVRTAPGLSLKSLNIQGLEFRQVSPQKFRVVQTFGFQPGPAFTTGVSAGFAMFDDEERSAPVVLEDGSKKTRPEAGGSPTLSWISANAVEQTTDQEAIYPAVGDNGFVSGTLTVQERRGKINERKPVSEDFGGDLI